MRELIFSRVHATLQSALSVRRSVSHVLLFFYDFISLTSLLLPKWSSDLKYGSCPPARYFGSRVSGLVFVDSTIKGTIATSVGTVNASAPPCGGIPVGDLRVNLLK